MRWCIDLALAQRYGRTALLALDWAKAFDSINVDALIIALRRFGLPEKILRLISHIYEDRLFSVADRSSCSSIHKTTVLWYIAGVSTFTLPVRHAHECDDEGRSWVSQPLVSGNVWHGVPGFPAVCRRHADCWCGRGARARAIECCGCDWTEIWNGASLL